MIPTSLGGLPLLRMLMRLLADPPPWPPSSTMGMPLTLYSPHHLAGLRDGRSRRQRDRVDDDAVLAALHFLHFAGLVLDRTDSYE